MNVDAPAWRPPVKLTLTAASLGLLAILTIGPLLLEPRPVDFLPPYSSAVMTGLGMACVLMLMAQALTIRARLDGLSEPHPYRNIALFAALAAVLTLLHWIEVDQHLVPMQWQRELYVGLFNHTFEAPHNYRPLPYGFARLVERLTHNWLFAILSYRWFFTFWFIWASYRLARMFLDPGRALWSLVPLILFYPLSVLYYWGQLTDPLSHTLFVLAFIYLLEDRPLALAAALALGVLAKETAVIVAPAYLACYWRRGWRTWFITAGLGLACLVAFLAARVPLGWGLGYDNLNGTTGLMIGTNLGFGEPIANLTIPLWMNYLHPLLFIGVFVPALIDRWPRIDPRLRAMCLTVTPLLLLSNVCFGWLYESRNYMPLGSLLATMAFTPRGEVVQPERPELHKAGT
jgi:hypothetical protein